MSDSFDERRKALEDSYFDKINNDALQRIRGRQTGERKSPITGKPMIQETYMGVAIDRCADSGGVWLDAGELEEIQKNIAAATGHHDGIVSSLFNGLRGAK